MKKKILWSDFLNPEKSIAINCETEEEANKFLKTLHDKEYDWCDGTCLIDVNMFSDYKELTCYCMYNDIDYTDELFVVFGSSNYLKGKNYTIYKFSEVEFVDSIETITVEINPNSISQAYKAVEKAINEYKKKQSEFTKEEIKKANELSEQLIVKLFKEQKNTSVSIHDDVVAVEVNSHYDSNYAKHFQVQVCEYFFFKNKDSYNTDIAICVCLCKMTNTEIPDFIKSKLK